MWIGWGEIHFRNPTVKVWANFDNQFKRSDYAKLCMSPSLDGTLPEYVISQEDNSPLTLYIDFSQFLIFLGNQYSFWSSSFIKAWTFITCPNIPKYKRRGKLLFSRKVQFCKNCTVPLDSCTVVTSQILKECHLIGRHTQN